MLLLALALWSAPSESGAPSEGAERFVVRPQISAVAVVLTPGQSEAKSDTSFVLSEFSSAIEPHTDLRVASTEQLGLDVARLLACPAAVRLTCWSHEIAGPQYLFVLSVSRREGAAPLISVLMLDVARARAERGPPDRIESAIYEATVRTKPMESITQLVTDELRPALERAGRWVEMGRVRLSLACDDCVIDLDDATLGAARRGDVLVDRIPPGHHTLAIRRGSKVRWAQSIEIAAGVETPLSADLTEGLTSRDVLLWGGAGTSAVGGVVGSIGLASIAGRAPHACVARSAAESDRCEAPSHDGAAALAIGTGLALAGVTWVSSALALSEDTWPEWLPYALGAAVGAIGGVAVVAAGP